MVARGRRELGPGTRIVQATILTVQLAVKNCFIRGSVVRYVRISQRSVDTTLLEDATRRGESW